eukprot:CAMPEP_0168432220 /NCGR_PEP_ID=MMETSP0228-20121227/38780_1 /TAXON_ID=133427 /ORGANISM="Protoceratium reticulatum, Strain CCCM 535 (=CCMP 1889)" /LENGTH=226 /DNA_ID=CAMNT_0008446343 /DNA_START=349 /DNA_END=1029 /DNA_ORIENTATION=-
MKGSLAHAAVRGPRVVDHEQLVAGQESQVRHITRQCNRGPGPRGERQAELLVQRGADQRELERAPPRVQHLRPRRVQQQPRPGATIEGSAALGASVRTLRVPGGVDTRTAKLSLEDHRYSKGAVHDACALLDTCGGDPIDGHQPVGLAQPEVRRVLIDSDGADPAAGAGRDEGDAEGLLQGGATHLHLEVAARSAGRGHVHLQERYRMALVGLNVLLLALARLRIE